MRRLWTRLLDQPVEVDVGLEHHQQHTKGDHEGKEREVPLVGQCRRVRRHAVLEEVPDRVFAKFDEPGAT